MRARASLLRLKGTTLILSLGILSSTAFADKDSLSHQFRVKARWHALGSVASGVFLTPLILRFMLTPAFAADAVHFKSEADLLKAAYIVHNKEKKKAKNKNKNFYSRKEIRDSERYMDEYYNVKLQERFPHHRIARKDVIEALALFYEDGASDGFFNNVKYYHSMDTSHPNTLTQLLFGDINTVHTEDQKYSFERQKYAYEQRMEARRKKIQDAIEYQKQADEAQRIRERLNEERYEDVMTELED